MNADQSITWPERILAELDESDCHAQAAAKGLSVEQINWRPSPDQWSIGQCLQHLLAFNRLYMPAILSALYGQASHPVREITPGWVSAWFMSKYVEPGPKTRRVRSPQKIRPDERINPSVLDEFISSNQDAKSAVRRAAGYDVNRIRYRNPLVPLVRFTVGAGLELTWKHQLRHLQQAERVKQAPGFPGQ
jgi:hypothetical protein